ncbi:hypothetical protein [Caldimonas brevitalea]|uniref:Uncharacterized protein n=1 Tax=Caldimonas brevitalea TaxID=413882 RepID=A0A0G3BJD7_9BURK|nr:hypothetical protein [Caldimonas brevitalea]AKJ27486.1 hypothetical protein AAW51_0795 [Caldimonas brevitalea]
MQKPSSASPRDPSRSQPAPASDSAATATQRSTRAPAEGAADDDRDYNQARADSGPAAGERSPRMPAEGQASDDDMSSRPAAGAAGTDSDRTARSDVAGSGNSLGDGRTAGGADNVGKRDALND